MQNDVPRNQPDEQAAIADLAVQRKVKLVWNNRRQVIQVKAPSSARVPPAGSEPRDAA